MQKFQSAIDKEPGLKRRPDSSGHQSPISKSGWEAETLQSQSIWGGALRTQEQPVALWILIVALGFIIITSFYLLRHKVSGDYKPYRIFSAGIAGGGEIPGGTKPLSQLRLGGNLISAGNADVIVVLYRGADGRRA